MLVIAGIGIFTHVRERMPSSMSRQTFHWVSPSVLDASGFATTTERVYFQGIPFQGADPTTFEVLVFPFGTTSAITSYARDQVHVYFFWNRWRGTTELSPAQFFSAIAGADPETFEPIFSNGNYLDESINYGSDKSHVYDSGNMIPSADPTTFNLIFDTSQSKTPFQEPSSTNSWPPTNFAMDGEHVYYLGIIFQGADAGTFILLPGARYAKDRYHVYSTRPDPQSTSAMPPQVPSADPSTFLELPESNISSDNCGAGCEYDASDQKHKYFNGKMVQ